jgi:hypothetical protein
MSEQFKVGEVVIGQNFVFSTHRNGMEAEIIGGLSEREGWDEVTLEYYASTCYEVLWADGRITIQEPHYLRRRKPPTTGEESVLALFKRTPQREGEPA